MIHHHWQDFGPRGYRDAVCRVWRCHRCRWELHLDVSEAKPLPSLHHYPDGEARGLNCEEIVIRGVMES